MRPDPDGAFFEDWRGWRDLGGGNERYPPARRHRPVYWCELRLDVPELGHQPGFVLRVPGNKLVHDLILPLRPTRYRKRMCGGKPANVYEEDNYQQMFYLPAARWQELRAVLPRVKAIITERAPRYYGLRHG